MPRGVKAPIPPAPPEAPKPTVAEDDQPAADVTSTSAVLAPEHVEPEADVILTVPELSNRLRDLVPTAQALHAAAQSDAQAAGWRFIADQLHNLAAYAQELSE
jgi:hypothetical protein